MSCFVCEISAEERHEDAVAAMLRSAGAEGVAVEGAPLVAAAIADGRAEVWDEAQAHPEDATVTVKGFFAAEKFPAKKAALEGAITVLSSLLKTNLQTRIYHLDDATWRDRWRDFYKPFRVGERLVVKPTRETWEADADDIVLELDPGMAFGTGSHPTTKGALTLLEKYVRAGDTVLDCGCGSGILTVAAALLGADRLYAADVDHDAVLATAANIRLNDILTKVEVFHRDVTEGSFSRFAPFDIVIANIVADVILPLLPIVSDDIRTGGTLILGGIIADRESEVLHAVVDNGFKITDIITAGNWVTLAAERV